MSSFDFANEMQMEVTTADVRYQVITLRESDLARRKLGFQTFFRNRLSKKKTVATEMMVGPGARFTVTLPIVICG